MPNPRLAARYAKSLIDLSVERDQLEASFADMQFLKQLCKASRDFCNMLRSPIIVPAKKRAVIDAIARDKISELTDKFVKLVIAKGREEDLPEIIDAFIEQYNKIKGIYKVKLTTAVAISDDLKSSIIDKVKREANLPNVELETKVNDALIGGFVLEFNNNLVDASVLRDLKDISKQFRERNVFVQHIR
ncbi:ATP synthase F1 subunit delta [Parafilimonas sp.]|uniref:ATP synthase F1 subunit delta n=1 Tax=Parafilimonas sp. TaxID=1969739 RepID=UPI0039E27CA0